MLLGRHYKSIPARILQHLVGLSNSIPQMIRFVNVVAFGAQLDEGLYNSDSRTALNKQNFVGGGGLMARHLNWLVTRSG